MQPVKVSNRDIFTTLSNIYDGFFLRKQLMTKSCKLFSQKAASQMSNRVLNKPLNKRNSNTTKNQASNSA